MAKKILKDPRGQHVRIYKDILNSPAWCCLSSSAKALWCDMRAQIGSTNNGTATIALEVLSHKGWSSRHTIGRARDELVVLGFIELTHQGGICRGGKSPNLYRFTDEPMYEQPKWGLAPCKPDFLFLKYQTHSEAKKEIAKLRLEKNMKVKNKHLKSEVNTPCIKKLSAEFVH